MASREVCACGEGRFTSCPPGVEEQTVQTSISSLLVASSNFSCAGFIISITQVGKSRFIVIIEIVQ